MEKDRAAICKIISRMLDNPDKSGIYPTSTAYTDLEHYIEQQRMEVLGWSHADDCIALDNGEDPRLMPVPEKIARMWDDLNHD